MPALAVAALVVSVPRADAVTRVIAHPDGTLRVTSGGTESMILMSGGGRVMVATGLLVETRPPCRGESPYLATCRRADVVRAVLDMRGGTDFVSVLGGFPVPVRVDGGRGDDFVEAGPGPVPEGLTEGADPVRVPVELRGGPGVDILVGGDRDDRLVGGRGHDRLFGGRGSDTLLGGDGDDLIVTEDQRADTLDCGGGVDRLRPDVGLDALRGCEQPPSEYALDESPIVIRHRFAVYAGGTRFTRLEASRLPPGAGVVVSCSGSRCPFETLRAEPAGPRWRAPAALARRRLPPGARLTVTATAPGFLTKVVDLRVRHRKRPARRVSCVGPQSGLVTACLSASWRPGRGVAS